MNSPPGEIVTCEVDVLSPRLYYYSPLKLPQLDTYLNDKNERTLNLEATLPNHTARVFRFASPNFYVFRNPHSIKGERRSVALVSGGWLPPSSLSPSSFILLDSSACGELLRDKSKDPGPCSDLNSLITDKITVNIGLSALEGHITDRYPTDSEVLSKISRLAERLTKKYPQLMVAPSTQSGIESILVMARRRREDIDKYRCFFEQIEDSMRARSAGVTKKTDASRNIIHVSRKLGLPHPSLHLLAVISMLWARKGKNPAFRVLRPDTRQWKNAVSDLWALETCALGCSSGDFQRSPFITFDKNLARLWTGLEICGDSAEGGAHKISAVRQSPLLRTVPGEILGELTSHI